MTTTVPTATRPLPTEQVYATYPEKKVTLYFLVTGLIMLLVGLAIGPLQALNYAGIDVYRYIPILKSYYQGLSCTGFSTRWCSPPTSSAGCCCTCPAAN